MKVVDHSGRSTSWVETHEIRGPSPAPPTRTWVVFGPEIPPPFGFRVQWEGLCRKIGVRSGDDKGPLYVQISLQHYKQKLKFVLLRSFSDNTMSGPYERDIIKCPLPAAEEGLETGTRVTHTPR